MPVTNLRHGHGRRGQRSTLYLTYHNIVHRCTNPANTHYDRYGGRGIKCLWGTFEDFLKDMGPSWKLGLTIDRKDNDGHYSKENCRWATRREQSRNVSRNRWLTVGTMKKLICEWEEICGFKSGTLASRVRRGWPLKELFEPLRPKFGYGI